MTKIVFTKAMVLIVVFSIQMVVGKEYFVSITGNDDNTGNDTNHALRTIKAGIKKMAAGDILTLRGGIYNEYGINLGGKTGASEEKPFILRSYNHEWAIIDGKHLEKDVPIIYSWTTWNTALCHWKFERIEVTGSGPDTTNKYDSKYGGKGFHFWPAHHVEWSKCYIHHNYGGASPNGGTGISIQNESGHGAQNCKINYCIFEDNGWPNQIDENISNIVLFTSYLNEPGNFPKLSGDPFSYPLQQNEISHNLIIGSSAGLKTKGFQPIVFDNKGTETNSLKGKKLGDKIHHNIFKGQNLSAILYFSDFQQIYNNVIDTRGKSKTTAIYCGPTYYSNLREAFYPVVYNNTIIGDGEYTNQYCAVTFDHSYNCKDESINYDALSEKYHPFLWFMNNLIYHTKKDTNFNVHINASYTKIESLNFFDWNTIHVNNNFFADRTIMSKSFSMGHLSEGFQLSTSIFDSKKYGSNNYSQSKSSSDLNISSNYKPTKDLEVNSSGIKIGEGGTGGFHPYFDSDDKVMIPNYIGAVPDTGKSWTDTVLNLKNDSLYDGAPVGNTFQAMKRGDSVLVKWNAYSGVQCSIYVSVSGNPEKLIGGKASLNDSLYWQIDTKDSIVNFRLRIYNSQGNIFDQTTSVNLNGKSEGNIRQYVKHINFNSNNNIALYNISGKRISSAGISSSKGGMPFGTRNLANGVYYACLKSANGNNSNKIYKSLTVIEK